MTPRQKRFVEEYLIDLNATQAAIRAGYSAHTAEQTASRLLRNVKVQEAIAAAQQARSQRTEITQDRVLREIASLSFADIRQLFDSNGRLRSVHELPDDVASAIASVDSYEEFAGSGDERRRIGEVRKIKLWDKVSALTLLAKHLGMLTEKREISGPNGGPQVMLYIPSNSREAGQTVDDQSATDD